MLNAFITARRCVHSIAPAQNDLFSFIKQKKRVRRDKLIEMLFPWPEWIQAPGQRGRVVVNSSFLYFLPEGSGA